MVLTVTVNLERYGHFCLPAIKEYVLENMWFRANMALLQETFPGRVIFRRDDINWPTRSCDLTLLDFVLWGYANDRVHAYKPSTLEHLRPKIVKLWRRYCTICVKKWSKMTSKESKVHVQHFAWKSFK